MLNPRRPPHPLDSPAGPSGERPVASSVSFGVPQRLLSTTAATPPAPGSSSPADDPHAPPAGNDASMRGHGAPGSRQDQGRYGSCLIPFAEGGKRVQEILKGGGVLWANRIEKKEDAFFQNGEQTFFKLALSIYEEA
jgi:hypothetical protein